MTLTPAEETIKSYLSAHGSYWPPTVVQIAENTGYPISTIYVALKALRASRVKLDKNKFGYVLPEERSVEFSSVDVSLGYIDGKPWRSVAKSTMRVVAEASVNTDITAKEYAEGFEALGYRFLELAAHADAVQDRADWKIVLGFNPDTEKE